MMVDHIAKNRLIKGFIVQAILYLRKLRLAICGGEEPQRESNLGNLNLLHLTAENYKVLTNHLMSEEKSNSHIPAE